MAAVPAGVWLWRVWRVVALLPCFLRCCFPFSCVSVNGSFSMNSRSTLSYSSQCMNERELKVWAVRSLWWTTSLLRSFTKTQSFTLRGHTRKDTESKALAALWASFKLSFTFPYLFHRNIAVTLVYRYSTVVDGIYSSSRSFCMWANWKWWVRSFPSSDEFWWDTSTCSCAYHH